MARVKFSLLPQKYPFQAGVYAAYHYKRYKFSVINPQKYFGYDEEELYGGGIGFDASYQFWNSGVFVYGNVEWLPIVSYMTNDQTDWGYTFAGGLGYSISGGSYLPMTLTVLAGYRYHTIQSSNYFDETVQSATCGLVISW